MNAIATANELPPRELEGFLNERWSSSGRISDVDYLYPGKTKSRRIGYLKCRWGDKSLFVKWGRGLRVDPDLEANLTLIRSRHFRTPFFFGKGSIGKKDFAVWEHLSFPWFPHFQQCSFAQLGQVVDMIAAINAASQMIKAKTPNARVGTLWVRPLADKTESDYFARIEAMALEKLGTLGEDFFSHIDIAYLNILLGEKVVLVDWELASFGAPGASLRGLAELSSEVQLRLAGRYSRRMQGHGYPVKEQDAYFVMGMMQVYFWLSHALSSGNGKLVRKALAAVPDFIERRL